MRCLIYKFIWTIKSIKLSYTLSQRTNIFIVQTYFMSLLLSIFLEIRRQQLISCTVYISLFPTGFHQFNRTISDMFAIHLLQSVEKISRISKWNKSIPSSFTCSPISYYSRHLKRRVSPKYTCEYLVINFVSQISTEYSIVILRPILHSLIFPNFSSRFPHYFSMWLFLFFYQFTFFW